VVPGGVSRLLHPQKAKKNTKHKTQNTKHKTQNTNKKKKWVAQSGKWICSNELARAIGGRARDGCRRFRAFLLFG
jgi:hypothetical protein